MTTKTVDPRFKSRISGTQIPEPLNIRVTYLDEKNIRVETDRMTNPLELGSLCSNIVTQQFNAINEQAMKANMRPDRYAIHVFDGDDTSKGCGICGRHADDADIHAQNHSTDIVS